MRRGDIVEIESYGIYLITPLRNHGDSVSVFPASHIDLNFNFKLKPV